MRDVSSRLANKEENRKLALKFDYEYFDGPRAQGYGGYKYDGRWVAVAQDIIDHWGLKPGDRVLDIGCAKGFLMHDLKSIMPSLEVVGLDISAYAINNAHGETRSKMVMGSCDRLPFADRSFALAMAINTVHNLDQKGCANALKEMQRVAPNGGFVQVDAYRDETERQVFEDWMLTARTYLMPHEWRAMFNETGYKGDYCWTVLQQDGSNL